jgi:MYXO-CTERM domain-containing protein
MGDSFEILRSDALAGTFTTEIMTDNPGLLWDVSYTTSSVFVTFGAVAPPGMGADFNGDGIVDGNDMAIWQSNYGLGSNPPPAATQADGDANGDGVVDGADFLLIQQKYGGPPAVPAVATVPEPSSVLLALAAFGLPLAARRRRS